jgi:D-alanine-D-alanine ligase
MNKLDFNTEAVLEKYKNKKIAVIYGGWSDERTISLQTGEAILNSLLSLNLNAFGLDLTLDNLDMLDIKNMDIADIAMHGKGGEDGKLQACLELKGIKYTGSNSFSSALAMDKYYTKKMLNSDKIPTAKYCKIDFDAENKNFDFDFAKIYDLLDFPFVVKPVSQGSAIGVYIVNSEDELKTALENISKLDTGALLESYINGREFTVGIVGNQILPVLEIVSSNNFYDFDAKYTEGKSRHEMPNDLDAEKLAEMQLIAKRTFDSVGCKGVARVDIMMDTNNNLFVLEINTIPGMTKTSLLPDACNRIGISFDELVLRILDASVCL